MAIDEALAGAVRSHSFGGDLIIRGLGEAISDYTGRVARQNLNVRSGFGALASLVCSAAPREVPQR